jgi:hypothetical protein
MRIAGEEPEDFGADDGKDPAANFGDLRPRDRDATV